MSTDKLGRRITYDSPLPPSASLPALLLVGDSFQELVDLENFLQSRGGQIISDIIMLTFEIDFRDVQRAFDPYLGRRKPVFQASGTRVNRGDGFRLSLLDRWMDWSRLAWLIRSKAAGLGKPRPIESAAGVDLVLGGLGALRRLGTASGARVHLYAYRRPEAAATISDSLWRSFVDRAGAIDVTDRMRATAGPSPIGFDGSHWSAAGHRRMASLILESFQRPPQG